MRLSFATLLLLYTTLFAFGAEFTPDSTKNAPILSDSTHKIPTLPRKPIIGLALSGGGAKGFAHIGVLKVLEEAGINVDIVTGTSMGAIVGGLYAIGYTPAEIESLSVHTDWMDLFDDTPQRRDLAMELKTFHERYQISVPFSKNGLELPTGIMSGQKVSTLLSRLSWHVHGDTDFTAFPRPFACIATDLETGNAVVLKSGYLPEALRASMAIPAVFTAVHTPGKLLVDGGVSRNLPVQDAFDLGADYVIAVDVGAPLKETRHITNLVDIIAQSISFRDASVNQQQRKLSNLLIQPYVGDLKILDFNRCAAIIQRGEDAARLQLPKLILLADSLNQYDQIEREFFQPADSVNITNIDIEGLDKTTRNLVASRLDLEAPKKVTVDQLEKAINRVYSTGFYERVGYKLRDNAEGNDLVVKVVEKKTDLLRFGFHYDSDIKAAAILNVTLRNIAWRGTMTTLDIVLGNAEHYNLSHYVMTDSRPRFGMQFLLDHERTDMMTQTEYSPYTELRVRNSRAEIYAGTLYSTSFVGGGGVEFDYNTVDVRNPVIGQPVRTTESFYTINSAIAVETLDRSVYPSDGILFNLLGQISDRKLGCRRTFRSIQSNFSGHLPIKHDWTLSGGYSVGAITGPEIPEGSVFWLGGVDDFMGWNYRESWGHARQSIRMGLQWEFLPKRFLLLRGNAGNVFDKWQWKFDRKQYEAGWGVTGGWLTIAGPLELTIHGTGTHRTLYNFRFGYMF